MSNSPTQPKSNPVTGGSITSGSLYGSVTLTTSGATGGPSSGGGPFGSSGSLTLTNNSNEHEQLSVEDIRMFKDMCGLLEYIASVDPKFKEYMMAYRAKQRILR